MPIGELIMFWQYKLIQTCMFDYGLVLKEMNTFIERGCIKLIKIGSLGICNFLF